MPVVRRGDQYCAVDDGRTLGCWASESTAAQALRNARNRVAEMPSGRTATRMTAREVEDLPDEAFAVIRPGGRMDSRGRTTPRTLRVLPFRDHQGNVVKPLAIDALMTMNQRRVGTNMPEPERRRAWHRVVDAIKEQDSSFIPPPRRF